MLRRPAIGWSMNLAGEHVPLGDEGGSYTGWARQPPVSDDVAMCATLLALCCFPPAWPLVPLVAASAVARKLGSSHG